LNIHESLRHIRDFLLSPLELISDAWALSSIPYNWSRRPEDTYGQGLIRWREKAYRDSLPRELKKASRIEAAAKRDFERKP
jgi:hypothetical protein